MTLIEGVGDEVIQFLGVVLVTMVGLFAWWSTNARPGRYRTVVVMRTRPHHPVTVSFRSRPNFMITNNQPSSSTSTNQESTTDTVAVSPSEAVEESRDASRVIPLQEMDSIIDADMAMMNNNRLHFYRRLDAPGSVQGIADSTSDESETQDEAEPASTDQIREMDSIVSAMEADVTAGCDFFTRPSEANANVTSTKSEKKNENSAPSSTSGVSKTESRDAATHVEENLITDDAGTTSSKDGGEGKDEGERKILIKLKYLNDTLKEVEGSLDELLKDFKWRHFSVELSAEARVRLIFNGRVLLDDAATLRALGLHHRAVVHALVHPPRPQQALGAAEAPAPELVSEAAAAERAWDFENILMTFMSVVLTIIWFFRCEYSNMFTTSASVALFGVTVFYSLAIFGLYLTDPSHFERRAPQPVPNN